MLNTTYGYFLINNDVYNTVYYLDQLDSVTEFLEKLLKGFFKLSLPLVMFSMMLNKRKSKALCQRHQHTETHTYGKFTGQHSCRHRFRLVQQIDRNNEENSEKERIQIRAYS